MLQARVNEKVLSEKIFSGSLVMEKIDFQSNLAMMENMELEEKVDIDDLVLPSKPMKLDKIVIFAVKEEPFESEERYSTTVHEEEKSSAFESAHERNKKYKLKMEDTILELYEQLDNEKYGNPLLDFSQRRSLRIR